MLYIICKYTLFVILVPKNMCIRIAIKRQEEDKRIASVVNPTVIHPLTTFVINWFIHFAELLSMYTMSHSYS